MQYWKLESIPYCLSHKMQQSHEYLVCYTKTAKIDENIKKSCFLSRLIPSHIGVATLICSFDRVFYALLNEHL